MAASSRIKQQTADSGNQKATHYAVFITYFFNQFAHRNRHHRISGKEAKLNQHRLGIVELENIFQMRNQNVVHAGNKTHHEEQGGQHSKGEIIVAFGGQAIFAGR